jgi:putative drug exporter of the RND superfamily
VTAVARFIHRFALVVVGVWISVAVLVNTGAPPLEQLITARDQPFLPSGTGTSLAVQRAAGAFGQQPDDNVDYLVLERNGPLTDGDRAFYDHLVGDLRGDPGHVNQVTDWWSNPATADSVLSEDHHVVTASMRLVGMVGTSQARESITAARNIVASLHPPAGLQVFVTGPGATLMDEFAAIDRQIQLITATTLAALLIMLLIVYRSPITALVPLLSVFAALSVAKAVVAYLVERDIIGVSLFSLGVSIAVVVGAGTGFSIFLIGRYHERRRQNFGSADALVDAYRAVAPAIVCSTLIVVTPLLAVGGLSLARISMFATTGILCSIGILAAGVAALTLTPALIALASYVGLLKPPQRMRTQRRFRRIGTTVARWPAPILVGSGVFVLILMIALPGVPIGWDESAATPAWAESNRGYKAVDDHFAPNQLLPDVVTIETDHDIRNPAGLTAVERITAAIMSLRGVRMVESASHPTGMVNKQAAMQPSGGNIGDRLDEFSDQLTGREGTFTDLNSAVNDVVSSIDLLQTGISSGVFQIGQASLAVHLMQEALAKVRARASDVADIFEPLRSFTAAISDCPSNPVCAAAQEVVQWSTTVVTSARKLVDGAEQIANGIANAASAATTPASIMASVGPQLQQVRALAGTLKDTLSNVGSTPIQDLPNYLHELAAVSEGSPGVDLYASRKILTDPNMHAVLGDFVSPDGRATRLFVFGDGHEWGAEGAQRARAIVAAVNDATRGGSLKPMAIELTGVGPATRDLQDIVGNDLALMVAITLAVILAIAALLLRSPLAGLIVLATIAASYVCALGASELLWRHVLGYDLHWSVPPIAFVLLVAVGSAGNLLFALRIREERPAGPHVSIIRAFTVTGAVVTVAGIVVGTTMFALATSSVLSVAQIGVTLGIGLLLDALVVRAFVLPALMVVTGRWLWWPRRINTIRSLPQPLAQANVPVSG